MNRNQKILYFLGPSIMTGSVISLKNIIDGVKNNYDVTVAISRKNVNIELVEDLRSSGVKIKYFIFEQLTYPVIREDKKIYDTFIYPYKVLKKIINILRDKKEIAQIIESVRPDIIHTNIGVLYQVISIAKKYNIPHIQHIREYQTKDFGWRIFPSKSYYQSQLRQSSVIAITKDIFNYFDLKDHKDACVMYNGILPKKSVYFVSNKNKYFLCASRISEEKGIDTVINAFDMVAAKFPDYEIWIAGSFSTPEYQEKIEKLINSKKFSQRIKLLGYRSDVIDLMKKATALIVASRFEGLGRMTVEATFSGCLVIGRDSGGTKEVLELTKGGFLFQTDYQLADLMVRVANLDQEDYLSMISKSQQIAIDTFSNENYCEYLIKKYNQLVSLKKTI